MLFASIYPVYVCMCIFAEIFCSYSSNLLTAVTPYCTRLTHPLNPLYSVSIMMEVPAHVLSARPASICIQRNQAALLMRTLVMGRSGGMLEEIHRSEWFPV